MNNPDAIIANATWGACWYCKFFDSKGGCGVASSPEDFEYDPLLESFVCKLYEQEEK